MKAARNEIRELVEKEVCNPTNVQSGVTSTSLAKKIKRSPSQVCQVLRALTVRGKVSHLTRKEEGRWRSLRHYFPAEQELEIGHSPQRQLVCGSYQWLSPIRRCTLLDLALECNPSVLPRALKNRATLQEIPRDTPACSYYDERLPGQFKSKPFLTFLRDCSQDGSLFRCPVDRCKQVIQEFSAPLQKVKIGSNTFYCPHCGAPIFFGFDQRLNEYRVYYWDSHFDRLQKSYFELTGEQLPSRNNPDHNYGVSIIKANSFTLKLDLEVLYVGTNTTPEQLVHSRDLTFFPLRLLNYIYTKYWDDYYYLAQKLQKTDPTTGRRLYEHITLFPPIDRIESIEPSAPEVGGNELLIATEILNKPTFHANIGTRMALIKTKIHNQLVDNDLRKYFEKSLAKIQETVQSYKNLNPLDFKQWQIREGGISSLMFQPFKQEAQKYGFQTPARPAARMVRYDHTLPYGLFYARSAYDTIINGVVSVLTTFLKKEVYNSIPFAWDGLRGWCHRRYTFGLYLDTIEQAKIIALLWIHEAIRNEDILPVDFKIRRGKRYAPYFCVVPGSEPHVKIQKIAFQTLNTTVYLASGKALKLKEAYHRHLVRLKNLLNLIASQSVEFLWKGANSDTHLITLWKKLAQTKNTTFLTRKEYEQLSAFSKRFFIEDFTFEPLAITTID
ncbi:MAG: hypothetical protein DRP02_05560 [Candidatus Gerdarchaeota archaeon]|nr:MAG: hypothetical protein DRP02_05560 [Candidatus Gerdarchaeota archaeon]